LWGGVGGGGGGDGGLDEQQECEHDRSGWGIVGRPVRWRGMAGGAVALMSQFTSGAASGFLEPASDYES
jgi:hypothetical protein